MPFQERLRESRSRLDQATDNLLSDLQCSQDRFIVLVGYYLAASQEYAKALLAARAGVSPEIGEAYAQEASFFLDPTQFIGLLYGYRKRLGFGDLKGQPGDGA
ncbi:MAG TPA: hypothetical protein VFW40_08705 [Capsulimonadaceae bacterium]|nr:hypothetical protein [Capsulimonadaceae bacterium]